MSTKTSKWVRVRRNSKCPICGSDDFCTLSIDGTTVHCQRVESQRKCPGEYGGWLHPNPGGKPPERPERKPIARLEDVGRLARKMFLANGAAEVRSRLALEWGVDSRVLESLRVGLGYDQHSGRGFASFPSRDGDGKIVGITRRYDDGSKRTLGGTSNGGIFAPDHWWERPGPVCLVEGASDTAVLLNAGLAALGRPSNVGGADVLRHYLKRRALDRSVIVLGERDRKLDRVGDIAHGCLLACPGCAWCWPGKYGAYSIASRLAQWRPVVVLPPDGFKDVREWARIGPQFAADVILQGRGVS